MNDPKDERRGRRQYPAFYERAVPVALAIIVVALFILLLVVAAIALGLFPGTG